MKASCTILADGFSRSRAAANRRVHADFFSMNERNPAADFDGTSLQEYRALLEPYDAAMMQWLQEEGNAAAFYKDPLAAFQSAVNAPPELIERLKNARLAPEDCNIRQPKAPNTLLSAVSNAVIEQIKDVTEGWDIVLGMDQTAINRALQYAYEKNVFPHTLAGTYEVPIKGFDTVTVQAELAAPCFSNGTGNDVTVSLRVPAGTLDLKGDTPVTGVDISGLELFLTVKLTKFKSPVQPETGERYDFYLDIADASAFVGFRIENMPAQLALYEFIVELAVITLLRTTFSGKKYKLFTADLQGAGEYSFLIPQEINYAGQELDDNVPAIGALLVTSGGHKGTVSLNAELFPKDAAGKRQSNAVLAMSRDLFLSNIGVSSLADALHMPADTFAYGSDKNQVYNVNEFDYFEKVEGYTVRIRSITLKIEGGELTLDIHARVTPSKGLYLDYTIHAPYIASLQTNESGGQAVRFDLDEENYHEDSSASAEWWVWLLAVLALLIGAIILAIILAVIEALAPELGADVFQDAIDEVDWNDLKIAELKSIELGDCIRIGCDAVLKP